MVFLANFAGWLFWVIENSFSKKLTAKIAKRAQSMRIKALKAHAMWVD